LFIFLIVELLGLKTASFKEAVFTFKTYFCASKKENDKN
tara:strand:- start:498 stop:614 length:117 start_codon:yes stop_codon:yes gene_type:complete